VDITVSVSDGNEGSESETFTLTVNPVNDPPVAVIAGGGSHEIAEGHAMSFDASLSNDYIDAANNGQVTSYLWNFGDGVQEVSSVPQVTHVYRDNADTPYTIWLRVMDNEGLVSEDPPTEVQILVNNLLPQVFLDPVPDFILPNESVVFSGGFTDAGVLDTHEAVWDFGDGITDPGSLTETDGSGTVEATYTFTEPRDFEVRVTVTDKGVSAYASVLVEVLSNEAAADELANRVDAQEGVGGLRKTLKGKLNNASQSFGKGNIGAGENQMGAFINSVKAQRGKKLSEEDANALIALAERIIASVDIEVANSGVKQGKGKVNAGKPALTKPVLVGGDAEVETYTFELGTSYPNPFNPITVIRYSLAEGSDVRLIIYNILGQEVRALVSGVQASGAYLVTWDGTDAFGRLVSSGVYFSRLTAGPNVAVRKMVFTK
jgi:PKD repeat protein